MPFKDDSARRKAFKIDRVDSFTSKSNNAFSSKQDQPNKNFNNYDSLTNLKNPIRTNEHTNSVGQGYTSYLGDVSRFTGNSNAEFREQAINIKDDRGYEIGNSKVSGRMAASNYVNEAAKFSPDNDLHGFTENKDIGFREQSVDIKNDYGYEISDNHNLTGVAAYNQTNLSTYNEVNTNNIVDRSALYAQISQVFKGEESDNNSDYTYNPSSDDVNRLSVPSDYGKNEISIDVYNNTSISEDISDAYVGTFVSNSWDTYTDRGGGATLHHDIDSKGAIRTQIQLNKEKDRTDRKGFKKKTAVFLEKAERTFEEVKPEKNESAASNVDDKFIVVSSIYNDHLRDERSRYHDIYKERKKLLKQIDKLERKADKKSNDPFNKSETKFQDRSDAFYDKFENSFKIPGIDRNGNSYFLPDEQQRIMSISASMGYSSNSADGFKVEAYNSQRGYSSYIDSKFSDKLPGNGEYIADNLAVDEKFSSINDVIKDKGLAPAVKKFEDGISDDYGNSTSRSVSSYFNDEGENGSTHKKGRTDERNNSNSSSKGNDKETLKSEKKEAKKQEKKAKKKMAAVAAVQNMLRAKKKLQNDVGNFEQVSSDDLIAAANPFLLQALIESVKKAVMDFVKRILAQIGSALMPMFIIIFGVGMMFVVILMTLEIYSNSATEGLSYGEGDGYTYDYLEDYEIDEIIENLYEKYDMTPEKEELIRYALTKVGCDYDQDYHSSLTVNIFDCSSLVYRSYREIGIDISNHGLYSAAEEARKVDEQGLLAFDELQPGDLIFYGPKPGNGRYKEIYHVAMYVGDGKAVEALGEKYGVVYSDLRTSKAIIYARYL